jgi:hypothetical protein
MLLAHIHMYYLMCFIFKKYPGFYLKTCWMYLASTLIVIPERFNAGVCGEPGVAVCGTPWQGHAHAHGAAPGRTPMARPGTHTIKGLGETFREGL